MIKRHTTTAFLFAAFAFLLLFSLTDAMAIEKAKIIMHSGDNFTGTAVTYLW